MPELQYRTRGNSSPQGKPRVYFTCHPSDFDRYFETTANLLLERQNCAVYYLPAGTELSPDELELSLGQMQLFVMPVTSRLLTEPCSALDTELPFAESHHIPVLPLMEEAGLDELFTQHFGNLQYLDPNASDVTAISFGEKLEKYLSGVLVGDALAEKVRAAFDAYIFLSYRKKDRKYAQQLMRLIHRIPACRDIAIWYDEYLTPGEDFNQAIAEALQKSELFTLVVTPNLINEQNYVLSTEYPMAREAGKTVIPVEMTETDQRDLHQKYTALPECLPGEAGETFDAGFLAAVRKLALDQREATPEHSFFIGLAYLDGIDVEVDSNRAVELITGAAEQGLTEAMEKLVAMYHDGKGVARDYDAAIRWQERLVEALRTGEDKNALFDALVKLGNSYNELGRQDQAEQAYLQTVEVTEGMDHSSPVTLQLLIRSYERLGTLCRSRKRLDQAKEWFHKNLFALWDLSKVARPANFFFSVSVCYQNLGYIEQDYGHLAEARDYFEKQISELDTLVEENPSPLNRRSYTVALDSIGKIERSYARLDSALDYFQKSFTMRKQLLEETNDFVDRQNLAVSCDNLGDVERERRHNAEAKAYYDYGVKLREQLVRERNTVAPRRELAISYDRLGDLEKEAGRLESARAFYQKSLALRQQLANETGTVEARRDLSIICDRLGDLEKDNGQTEAARQYYAKSHSIRTYLVKEASTIEARRDLSISCDRLGDLEKSAGHLREATSFYTQSYSLREALLQEADSAQTRRDFTLSCDRLGDVERANKRYQNAKAYYAKSLAQREQLAKETGTVQARQDLAISLAKLGDVEKNLQNEDAAWRWYERCLALRERLTQELGTVGTQQSLISITNAMAALALKQGRSDVARTYYLKKLAACKRVASETGTAQARRVLSIVLSELGTLERNQHNLNEAEQWYRQCFSIRERLAAQNVTRIDYHNFTLICVNLAKLCSDRGNEVDAYQYCVTAIPYEKQYAEMTGDKQTLYALYNATVNPPSQPMPPAQSATTHPFSGLFGKKQ